MKKLLPLIATLATATLLSCALASEAGAAGLPHFKSKPALIPSFDWNQHDYAVRCKGRKVKLDFHLPAGWVGFIENNNSNV